MNKITKTGFVMIGPVAIENAINRTAMIETVVGRAGGVMIWPMIGAGVERHLLLRRSGSPSAPHHLVAVTFTTRSLLMTSDRRWAGWTQGGSRGG